MTFGVFHTGFGMFVSALPLYVKDVLHYGSGGVGVAVGAASCAGGSATATAGCICSSGAAA